MLRQIMDKLGKVGTGFLTDLDKLEGLKNGLDEMTVKQFNAIKLEKKRQLCRVIEEHEGVALDPSFLFDVQVKRLHEYKRQMLNALCIMDLYLSIKDGTLTDFTPTAFIFGAKAAPGYRRAKAIIHYVNRVAELINNDPAMEGVMKVVFVQNYNCSYAEHIIPAADISEQISPAGTEASGTGNMKLMLNGAVTLGTLDGANVEIHEQVGDENIFLFGMKAHEVEELWQRGYHPTEFVTPELQAVLDMLTSGVLGQRFDDLVDSLLTNRFGTADPYMTLADFQDYARAQRDVAAVYQDKQHFARMSLINIAKAGIFSSDRAVKEYADEIWNLD